MFDALFGNVGGKIKTLVKVMFFLEVMGSFVGAIACFSSVEDGELLGLGIAVVGPLVAWISSLALYAFGELVESNLRISRGVERLTGSNTATQQDPKTAVNTNSFSAQSTQTDSPVVYWTCSRCKRENSDHRAECWYCGEKK